MALAHGVTDGVHEVGLAEPHAPVDEERVVGLARRVGYGAARRMGEAADVAKAIRSIADGLLDYSTGQVINVDGGFHLRTL